MPREELLRLSGIQKVVDQLLCVLEREAFGALFELLTERGAAEARGCPKCGLKTDSERKSCRINTKRLELRVDVWRYRCRACNTARSPVRDWLGLESGPPTIGLDRALASLAVRMSFEDAAKQMQEQHGHEVDRTLSRGEPTRRRGSRRTISERGARPALTRIRTGRERLRAPPAWTFRSTAAACEPAHFSGHPSRRRRRSRRSGGCRRGRDRARVGRFERSSRTSLAS